MQQDPTVRLQCSDTSLYRRLAPQLTSAGYQVVQGAPGRLPPADIVVRDWKEEDSGLEPGQSGGSKEPVLTLDFSLLTGEEMVEVLSRVLPRSPRWAGASTLE